MTTSTPYKIPDLKGKTILIVEDDIASYTFLSEEISQTGADIIWTKSGSEAVKICKSNLSVDLVLMDIKLSEGDGYSATQQIKSNRNNLPVIAQTSFALVAQRDLLFQAGCDNFIKKPLRAKDILILLDRYLNKCNYQSN